MDNHESIYYAINLNIILSFMFLEILILYFYIGSIKLFSQKNWLCLEKIFYFSSLLQNYYTCWVNVMTHETNKFDFTSP